MWSKMRAEATDRDAVWEQIAGTVGVAIAYAENFILLVSQVTVPVTNATEAEQWREQWREQWERWREQWREQWREHN
jgi:hypothetical protein